MTNDGMTNDEGMSNDEDDDAFWKAGDSIVVREEAEKQRTFDLEEGTARFGQAVIDFAEDDSTPSGNGAVDRATCRLWHKRWRELLRS